MWQPVTISSGVCISRSLLRLSEGVLFVVWTIVDGAFFRNHVTCSISGCNISHFTWIFGRSVIGLYFNYKFV